jgi:hypothetical protein
MLGTRQRRFVKCFFFRFFTYNFTVELAAPDVPLRLILGCHLDSDMQKSKCCLLIQLDVVGREKT